MKIESLEHQEATGEMEISRLQERPKSSWTDGDVRWLTEKEKELKLCRAEMARLRKELAELG